MLLSNKQMWRKQLGFARAHHDDAYWKSVMQAANDTISACHSVFKGEKAPMEKHCDFIPIKMEEVAKEVNEDVPSASKRVKFNTTVFVVLVPEKSEYKKAGITGIVWWNRQNYRDFAASARNEVKLYMTEKQVDFREAARALYQPQEAVKPIGSPTSVVPSYEEYLMLVASQAMKPKRCESECSEVIELTNESTNTDAEANCNANVFQSLSGNTGGFQPVKGRERNCSIVCENTDDSWTVLKQNAGCMGIL